MSPARLSSLLLLPLFAGAALVATDASAQLSRTSAAPNGRRVVQQAPQPMSQNVANVSTDALRGTASVASNGALDGVPLLNGFHFRFSNGDHELRRISALVASTSSATISFADKNADDPYKAAATWINVKGAGARGAVHAAGYAQFDVPLPTQRPPNTRLVLTGFEFRDEDDEDVQMIGVWLDEARNVARVSLLSYVGFGEWYAGAGARLGTAGTPISAFHSKAEVFASADAADQWVRRKQDGSRLRRSPAVRVHSDLDRRGRGLLHGNVASGGVRQGLPTPLGDSGLRVLLRQQATPHPRDRRHAAPARQRRLRPGACR